MSDRTETKQRRGRSVSAKISLGFSIVLVLHISIALLGHYGLSKSRRDLETYKSLHEQVERFDAIDRVVGALQRNVLLFAFTGYHGPEVRAAQLHDKLEILLDQAEEPTLPNADSSAIGEMKVHLKAHREIFETVVVDRANRRRLVNEVLTQCSQDFAAGIRNLSGNHGTPNVASAVAAAFQAAELNTMQFINAPDSIHVRHAMSNLAAAKRLLNQLEGVADGNPVEAIQTTRAAVQGYEEAVIQMVQATRGYLHLVNVVLAGESEEFRRLAGEIRRQQSNHVGKLATVMADDSHRFQSASNVFSVITIVIGVAAAWLIGRNVAPPLNAIARTFDELTHGKSCEKIPALGRSDELGRLAAAAQVFKDKAVETERLLAIAESSQDELNKLNQQLATQTALAQEMAEEATAATLAKSEFLANMSHEIRTPMTAILGFSELVLANVTDQESIDALNTVRKNGEYLLEIINDILDLSKIEAGKLQVEHIKCSPSQIISDVASLMDVRASAKGLLLEVEHEGPLPEHIRSDPTRLQQILINLIGNAVKFTEVGKVRLVTHLLDAGTNDPKLRFDVVDTGIGMTDEHVGRLFQAFSQADSTTTRKFGGTGLGLTISKRMANMLGGDIRVRSTPGEGSTFSLTVSTGPLTGVQMVYGSNNEHLPAKEAAKAADSRNQLDCRVLLAEDGPDNQRLISFILKKAGADVVVAENGQVAFDRALAASEEGSPFDVILMDMQMPVLDGYGATGKLREAGYSGGIIALTAHAMSGDREKCLNAGCDDYTTKPIVREHLISLVAHWASQPSSPVICSAP